MSDDATYNVAADELRQFIEQIEGLEHEKAAVALFQAVLYGVSSHNLK